MDLYCHIFLDVDPPRDLTAVNIQTESATLTWKPPQVAVTAYLLTFSSADGIIRVCTSSHHVGAFEKTQLIELFFQKATFLLQEHNRYTL